MTWAGPDGRFGLGLLAGQYIKPEAGFVGAGAREATRRRRLAEIDAAIAEQRTILQTREHEINALDSRLTRLGEEIADAPSDADLGTTRTTLTERRGDETRAIEEYKRLDEAAAALVASEREREDALREELAAAGLPFEKVALARAQAAIGNYQVAIVELVTAVRDAKRTADESERLGDEALRVHAKAVTARELATKAAGTARGLRATATELLALHGADAKTALQRLVELETEEKRLNDALDTARSNRITRGDDAATAKAELTIAREKLAEATEHWRSTTTTFRRFAASGLLELVRGPIEGDPTMWDDQHTASIAATIDASDTASFAEPARNALAGAVNRRYNELGSELGADFALDITQSPEDGLLLVEAQHGDDRTSIAGLGVVLDAEVDERAALLDRRTRELLSRYLLDGVGEELGERSREARTLIDRMNGELARCPTASGRTLRLRWELADEAPEGARRASELFLLPPANLNDADRGSLIEFLRDRVATARADEASPGFAAALATALDYRTWFVFRIDESTPTGWHRLTTRSHAAGSGGEQAVALHLPLFAAVAAYYSTAAHHAPRLFFLDEAFAGIDRPMRGLLMRFLVHFDLDFVFTSPDDWGTYAELDGAGIYHLYRDRDGGVCGVLARRFVWDGARLLDEAALRALDEQAG